MEDPVLVTVQNLMQKERKGISERFHVNVNIELPYCS